MSGSAQRPVMTDVFTLTYEEELSPVLSRYVDGLLQGRILGHRCPSCANVFVPGKGFCPLCLTATGPEDEAEVADRGVVTGFTVVTPIPYHGQRETEPFAYATVRLDGASSVLAGQESGQNILYIPHDQIRAGMRVKAVWKPESERNLDDLNGRGWGAMAGVIAGFAPTGEPDEDPTAYRRYLA